MKVQLYVVPLGHNRFTTIIARDGNVTVEQIENLVGNDGLGLELIPVESFGTEETETEEEPVG